jgi:hypothetical protein
LIVFKIAFLKIKLDLAVWWHFHSYLHKSVQWLSTVISFMYRYKFLSINFTLNYSRIPDRLHRCRNGWWKLMESRGAKCDRKTEPASSLILHRFIVQSKVTEPNGEITRVVDMGVGHETKTQYTPIRNGAGIHAISFKRPSHNLSNNSLCVCMMDDVLYSLTLMDLYELRWEKNNS